MSHEPTIVISFDGNGHPRRPGETLSGEYWIESLAAARIKAIETSVLWYSEGKGDEDMGVCAFWRRDVDENHAFDPAKPERFSAVLPNSPQSYDGHIIKLRWCVRVRVFLRRGRQLVGQKGFQLGNVGRPLACPTGLEP